ncbi:putative polysaccharide biosynthesis protein [Vagococcus coleopterorum]|uniref:putative polysaccharide biosynthesis protein n=1 Tax=Vagococcus coleopterorum TaxID=2714946 RepID=UPI003B82E1E6
MTKKKATATHELDAKQKMVRGSLWMTVGSVVSRLMGAIYIIPWYAWMGDHAKVANNLFTKGYNIYALFLMIATAGIPGAIAKQISHYNSLNEYGLSKKLFKKSMVVMMGLGIAFAAIMYFAAPILAAGEADLIPTMRALSFGLLIFPCMSVIRGFFQGYHDMMPSAISQMAEQFARVFYMLLATFIIMKVGQGDYVAAVTQSTFAAFIGMIAAMAALGYYYFKGSARMKMLEENSSNQLTISTSELLKNMMIEAMPFIIIGSAITIVKIFDQYTFEKAMGHLTNYTGTQIKELFSVFSANPDKLTMITISIATSLAVTSLPLVTEAFTLKDKKGVARLISDNFQLFFFVMIPATLGMIILAYPLNTLFYEPDTLGSSVLVQACYVGIILGFYMLVSTTLQGLYENKQAMLFLAIGFVIKVVLQYPFIAVFHVYGPLLSTAICFLVASYLTTAHIQRMTDFDIVLTMKRTLLILGLSLIMTLVAFLTRSLLYIFLSPDSKIQSLIIVLIVGLVGMVVYGYMALKLKLADRLLGDKVAGLRRKLKIKAL